MGDVGINRVLVLGRVSKYGVALCQQGTDCARFVLAVPEAGKDGKTYTTRIPIEIWGKHAHMTTTLAAGQLVLVEGKLKRRKRPDDEWEFVVSSFEATPVLPATSGSDPRQPSLF
jgi:single-stranded DNA-binding protein